MAKKRSSIARAMGRSGGWGKAIKRKKAGKKRAKKAGKRRAKKSGKRRTKKRASKRRVIGRPKTRKSTRRSRPRKKGSKRRATTTTFKTSGVKLKMKCPPGKAAKATSLKSRRGAVTHIAMGARCIRL